MSALNEKDPKAADLENLGEDELDSIEITDDDEIIQEPAPKDKDEKLKDDPVEKKDPPPDAKIVDDKDPKEKKDPEEKPDPDPDPKADDTDDKDPAAQKDPDPDLFTEDDQKEMDRLGGPEKVYKSGINTKAQLTKANQEISDTKQELENLKAKNLISDKEKSSEIDPKLKAFRELDDTEKNDLAQDSPEEFRKFVEADIKQKNDQVDLETTRQNDAHRKQAENLFTWLKDEKDIDAKKDPGSAKKYLDGDEFTKLDKELSDNYKRQADGTFTVRQMKSAFLHVNKDNMLEQERIKSRQKTLDDIERAKGGGSPLDRTGKEEGDTKNRDYADLTEKLNSEHPSDVDKALTEIDQMGEEEMNQWEKYNESVGMS